MKEKLLFIGHYYHKKTKSCDFFIEILKEKYDVTVFFDESHGTDTSIISKTIKDYKNIVFWQIMPKPDLIKDIKAKNVTLCPMFDQIFVLTFEQWKIYRNFKIVNFSKFLHNRLKFSGFNSFYAKYFIEPKQFLVGDARQVFFWHRVADISVKNVLALFKKGDFSIHIHRAIDPGHNSELPLAEDIEKYNITISDWFDKKEEMINCIAEKGIFIAPRIREGIGMSFLEAMAMGKAVIANNEPTMNEYIVHNKNGYLCNFSKIAPIKFKNIAKVQKKAYKTVQKGYKKWLKRKPALLNFIEKAAPKDKINYLSPSVYDLLGRQLTKHKILDFFRKFYYIVIK